MEAVIRPAVRRAVISVVLPPLSVIWSFALFVALLTVTPGLDTALVLRTAAIAGHRRGIGVIAGIQTGTMVWGALAAAGVSAILLASEAVYTVLRVLGALYLVLLGGRMLVAAVRGAHLDPLKASIGPDRFVGGWRQGLTGNLLNPKMGAFYIALLPQFIPVSAPQLVWGVALASVHVVLGTAWLTVLMLSARRFRRWLERPRVARGVDGVAGLAIVGFGVKLATEGAGR